jgi:hypothetical protein
MSNIIGFPTKSVRDWQIIRSTLIDLLSQSSVSEEFVTVILERMKIAYDEHEFNFDILLNLPDKYNEQVTEKLGIFSKALQQRTNELLVSRLILEIKLAKYEGYK